MNKKYLVYGDNLIVSDENGKLRVMRNTWETKKILGVENDVEKISNQLRKLDRDRTDTQIELHETRKSKVSTLCGGALCLGSGALIMIGAILDFPFDVPLIIPLILSSVEWVASYMGFKYYFEAKRDVKNLKNDLELIQVQSAFLGRQLRLEQMHLNQLQQETDSLELDTSVKSVSNTYDKQKLKQLLRCMKKLNTDARLNQEMTSNQFYNSYSHLVSEEEFDEIVDTYRLVRIKNEVDL